MRKLALILGLALAPLVLTPQPAPAATAKPSAEEAQLIKKKKAAEAKKAAEEKKAAEARKARAKQQAEARKAREKRIAAARRAEEVKKAEARKAEAKKAAEARRKAAAQKSAAQRSTRARCDGFVDCLFGNKPRAGVQKASTASVARDMPTGEDIDWAPAAKYTPGSIVVQTPERALYLVTGPGEARRYSVGVGREGFQWSGTSRIAAKAEWPTWRPPAEMIKREAAKGHMLPDVMEGGPENPLGARALYIGGSIFRIHGTNAPGSIGGAVSSGCIRMMNTDVIDLYDRVKVGAKVYVYQ